MLKFPFPAATCNGVINLASEVSTLGFARKRISTASSISYSMSRNVVSKSNDDNKLQDEIFTYAQQDVRRFVR